MIKLAASIMCANQLNLKEELIKLEEANIDLLHCDVMDGMFVNNLAMGPYVLEDINEFTNIPLDIHLATLNPQKYIKLFLKLKPKYISFHIESANNVNECIDLIKSNGIRASIAVSPSTPIYKIKDYLKYLDMVLVMTVNPGFEGQQFNYNVLDKLMYLKELCIIYNVNPLIEVDGCINKDTISLVREKSANVFVLGTSALFKKDSNYKKIIKELRKKE